MKTIWKYLLELTDVQTLEMPEGSIILTTQMQGDTLSLWAITYPERAKRPLQRRTIVIYGTGHTMRTDCEDKFIATVQQAGGSLVWHVFERV